MKYIVREKQIDKHKCQNSIFCADLVWHSISPASSSGSALLCGTSSRKCAGSLCVCSLALAAVHWPQYFLQQHSKQVSTLASPSSFTSARPGRPAKPTLATPLSVDCQCLATVTLTVTVATQHFTLLSALKASVSFCVSKVSGCPDCPDYAFVVM